MKLDFTFGKNKWPWPRISEEPDADSTEAQNQSIPGLETLYVPEDEKEAKGETLCNVDKTCQRDIIDILLDMGLLCEPQPQKIREQLSDAGASSQSEIEAKLLHSGFVDIVDILTAKAEQLGIEFRHIEAELVEEQAFKKLNIESNMSGANTVIDIAIEDDTLVVATSRPDDIFAMEDIENLTQMELKIVASPQADIDAACAFIMNEGSDYCVDDIIHDMSDIEVVREQEEQCEDLEKMAGQSPVIKFVNYLISNAIREGASDIHVEPKSKSSLIRYRIDGALFETMQSPLKMHPAIISRIKIMSNLDISERRLPQDGKISVIVGGRAVDLRVSVLPTSHGEKVVIRVLDSKSIMRGLEQLGMETEVMEAFREQISQPHGILLVTGPTGSGKSTTLYSALTQMDGNKLNISTVEDPVEYELDFCNQVQANDRIGLDFAAALRSLLRQDPDIIMVGEIRDSETARVAVQAALTGHLVLSTLHTNDAPSSITRLVNIGIDPYLIAASLNAVLAQRLVRKICPKCKEKSAVPETLEKYVQKTGIDPEQFFRGKGCSACRNSGYQGRIGIYEFLIIDDAFRDMINRDSDVTNMRRAFHKSKQASLFEDGIKKVKKGLTTIEEVLRVTEMYGDSEESC